MNSEWVIKCLGDCCDKIGSGATPKGGKDVYLDTGPVRLIRSQNIYNEGFVSAGLAFISDEQAKRLDSVSVQAGDVLLNITGDSVARVCQAPEEFIPARVNQHVAIIRPRPSSFDARFLRYFLASPIQQDLMFGLAAAGATRNALTKGMIESFQVPCPPLAIQSSIAETLGSLDDRITLLRETNATLEAIAQALFKSWFVDFDPVRAKMEGRVPEGMDEATAELFPDSFEETELGEVPRGWEILPIGDLVETLGGATPDTKQEAYWSPGVHHWSSPKDLSGLSSPVLLDTERRISPAGLAKIGSGLLPAGTLLMSSRAPIGYLAISHMPIAINQGYIAMTPGGKLPPRFMLFWCRNNMDLIKGRANGSTFMEISKKAFRPIPAVLPESVLINKFMNIINPLFDKVINNEIQILALTGARDLLLPNLISGKINLKVEKC